jgi:hypothetical protein
VKLLRTRRASDPNPYVIGNAAVQNLPDGRRGVRESRAGRTQRVRPLGNIHRPAMRSAR